MHINIFPALVLALTIFKNYSNAYIELLDPIILYPSPPSLPFSRKATRCSSSVLYRHGWPTRPATDFPPSRPLVSLGSAWFVCSAGSAWFSLPDRPAGDASSGLSETTDLCFPVEGSALQKICLKVVTYIYYPF
jgi:hypothetical protein